MILGSAFCCRGDSAAAEQTEIISEAQKLGFEARREINQGQVVLVLTKVIQGEEKTFTITGRQSWEALRAAVLESKDGCIK